jgi:hypothetical protein
VRVNIEVLTPEGAVVAARVAAAVSAAMNGEGTVTTGTRSRRTKAEIEADNAKAAAATAGSEPAKVDAPPPVVINTQPPADKPDPVTQYLALSGGQTPTSQPDTATKSEPASDKAPDVVDPMDALMAAASAPPPPADTGKSRDEMIAAIVKLMGEKGVPWARENIIGKYKASKFADMADDLVAQIYTENCV